MSKKALEEVLRYISLREHELRDETEEAEKFHGCQKNSLCDHIERLDNYITSLEAQVVKANGVVDSTKSAGPIELKYFRWKP